MERSSTYHFIEEYDTWCDLKDECQIIWVLEFQNISVICHHTGQLYFWEILKSNCILQLSGEVITSLTFSKSSTLKISKHHSRFLPRFHAMCTNSTTQFATLAKHLLYISSLFSSSSLHKFTSLLWTGKTSQITQE